MFPSRANSRSGGDHLEARQRSSEDLRPRCERPEGQVHEGARPSDGGDLLACASGGLGEVQQCPPPHGRVLREQDPVLHCVRAGHRVFVRTAGAEHGDVTVVADARRKEVYWARYRDGRRMEGPEVEAMEV